MEKFKRFQRFKHKTTDIDNVNVQDGGGPQATVGSTASIGEQLATRCQTPEANFSVAVHDDGISAKITLPFKLKLSDEEVKVLQTDIHNSLEIVLRPYFKGKLGVPIEENTLDEQSVPKDWRLRDVHKHLTKRGWSEDRHSGGHKIYIHPAKGTISIPAHPTAPISPGLVRQVFKMAENGEDQMLVVRSKPTKSFSRKATNVSPQTDRHPIGTIVSGDGTIGLSEVFEYEGGQHRLVVHEPADGKETLYHVGQGEDYKTPLGKRLSHSYTDTTMEYTRHHHQPHPVHTHHMDIIDA